MGWSNLAVEDSITSMFVRFNFIKNENVWFDEEDIFNITTKFGWSMIWDVAKFNRSMETIIHVPELLQMPNTSITSITGLIPPIALTFHRRLSYCKMSFDAEIFVESEQGSEPSELYVSFLIYIGVTGKMHPVYKKLISETPPEDGKYHFEFISRDNHGITVHGVYLFPHYFGVSSINGTKRQVVISNLEIFEKFVHQTDGEWYQPYKKNAEARLSSESLKTKLEENLGTSFSEGQAIGSIASGRNVCLSSLKGPVRIREGVTLFIYHQEKYWQDRNYIYKYSNYPFHMVGFIEYIKHFSLWFQLLGDNPGENHW